jgi:hypothetical protein
VLATCQAGALGAPLEACAEVVFDGSSRQPVYRIGRCTMELGELFPIGGGVWCRLCGGVSESDGEVERDWGTCRGCRGAYHRRCVVEEGWEERLGGRNWKRWWCQGCNTRS